MGQRDDVNVGAGCADRPSRQVLQFAHEAGKAPARECWTAPAPSTRRLDWVVLTPGGTRRPPTLEPSVSGPGPWSSRALVGGRLARRLVADHLRRRWNRLGYRTTDLLVTADGIQGLMPGARSKLLSPCPSRTFSASEREPFACSAGQRRRPAWKPIGRDCRSPSFNLRSFPTTVKLVLH